MATPTPLKPSIFDRLIGELGSTERRGAMLPCYVPRLDRFGESELRACLLRDIGWLLNDIRLDTAVSLEGYSEVSSSVINQGLPDLTGKSVDRDGLGERANQIAATLRRFEPRLEPHSIVVDVDGSRSVANQIQFQISGSIVSSRDDDRFVVATALDLDTGNVDVD